MANRDKGPLKHSRSMIKECSRIKGTIKGASLLLQSLDKELGLNLKRIRSMSRRRNSDKMRSNSECKGIPKSRISPRRWSKKYLNQFSRPMNILIHRISKAREFILI